MKGTRGGTVSTGTIGALDRRRQARDHLLPGRVAGRVLSKWIGEQKPGVLPKSPLGSAIVYATNNWGALKRYLDQGFLALDNNLSGRSGRSHSGGTTGA